MKHADYLVAGASHAALQAARAIRQFDQGGSLVMLGRDARPPYSPTALPYVVSGKLAAERAGLASMDDLAALGVDFVGGDPLTAIDPDDHLATTASGVQWRYGRLLLATGADPLRPPIPGLDRVPHHLLRSMADAEGLRAGGAAAAEALVIGAGLVGLHAAENLARAGCRVTVVERGEQLLPGYLDADSAALLAAAAERHGVRLVTGVEVTALSESDGRVRADTNAGETYAADLLLVAAGVAPALGYLDGSGIEIGRGILVDRRMRTSAADVWAAGDVAEADDFLSGERRVLGILPVAAEQGRIAGRDMAGDDAAPEYAGALPVNTCTFFGIRALAVGRVGEPGSEVLRRGDAGYCLALAFRKGRLRGMAAVDVAVDTGIMARLIRGGRDLGPWRERLLADPVAAGRALMSADWG